MNTLLQGPWWLVLPAGFGGGEKGKWVYGHARKNHRILCASLHKMGVKVVGKTYILYT